METYKAKNVFNPTTWFIYTKYRPDPPGLGIAQRARHQTNRHILGRGLAVRGWEGVRAVAGSTRGSMPLFLFFFFFFLLLKQLRDSANAGCKQPAVGQLQSIPGAAGPLSEGSQDAAPSTRTPKQPPACVTAVTYRSARKLLFLFQGRLLETRFCRPGQLCLCAAQARL